MNSLVLGGILKRLYTNFDMRTFDNRLKLQKIVYLIQECAGINLGYSFHFYNYGPYCTELTRDAFQIEEFSKVREVGFEDKEIENKFLNFINKIESKKNNTFWLEVASSLNLFKRLFPSKNKGQLIESVCNKRAELNGKRTEIEGVWNNLLDLGWI